MPQDRPPPPRWFEVGPPVAEPEAEPPAELDVPDLNDPLTRRRFLTLMGASLGLAGLSGCNPSAAPRERIVPYVRQPEDIIPGQPLYFATAMPLGGDALGLLVESHEGRPTKVEGNPDHPGSPRPPGSPDRVRYGATDLFAQASVLSLYDPDRAQAVTHLGNVSPWQNFVAEWTALVRRKGSGLRLRLLMETVTSPSLAQQLAGLTQRFPQAKWHVWEPIHRENVREARPDGFAAQYRLEVADVILAVDADLLSCGPGHVRYLHDFAQRRRVGPNQIQRMNRLYVVESTPSGTGAMADHRLPLRSTDVELFARALAAALDERFRPLLGSATSSVPREWLTVLAADLRNHHGTSLVVAGDGQPPDVHRIAQALNEFLGNVGQTVVYTAPAEVSPPAGRTLRELVTDMQAGRVDAVVIVGGNPAYTAPADVAFSAAMNRVDFRAHLSLYANETSDLCHWHIPEAHYLESWGDTGASDGTLSLLQPLIAPLYRGRTAAELLAVVIDGQERLGYDLLRAYWQGQRGSGDFEGWWHEALRKGVAVPVPSSPPIGPPMGPIGPMGTDSAGANALEIVFRPDPTLYDGRFANNAWLQELPKPLTKLTWGNAAFLSPATAQRLGLANEDVVELQYQGRTVEAPVWVMPGHADNSVTVHLGHGQARAGRVGGNVGFNAYKLRTAAARWFGTGLTIRPTGRRQTLVATQHHHQMENRDPVRTGTVQNPPRRTSLEVVPTTLYNHTRDTATGSQWGMVIDLSACTGCSACIVACQAENNIPVVGKDEVRRGHEMHWLRVDAYFQGEPGRDAVANPRTYFQPVPCMHCETAPCELVCPVGATAHSSDGLNDMVYNRCVGTRYCSNNCPYKVRRFNFFQYSDFATESLRLGRNPDVTVRSRGVMEKCTYCVQRIRGAEIAARVDGRPLRDGDVVTACQAVCPAGAIVFGDLSVPQSQVRRLRDNPLNYELLGHLNTHPRTTYLAALKNPNPEMHA
jgi:molybdopterin-containing oxidoreductase family iron-sulfur binding subunit